ncbi:glycosyltransferase [soil metagenome]
MLCIVIPVHNRKAFTRDCLRSLRSQSLLPDHIVVTDDGSTDGTAEMLSIEFPLVHVLNGDGNLFWTAAINLGIKFALTLGADHVLTLNNDTIASNTFIEEMMRASVEKPNALIGAVDFDLATKTPYYGGEIINWRTNTSTFLLETLQANQQKGLHEVSLFPGRGLLIPRIVFDSIGLFEERKLPHYMADYDFTLMAARNGFPVYCNYNAVLYTYPEEGGDQKIRKSKTLKNYFDHLFGIRGGGNLRNYTVYVYRNCPRQEILSALIVGYSRRIGGFWIK